jgi:hypothetical protein
MSRQLHDITSHFVALPVYVTVTPVAFSDYLHTRRPHSALKLCVMMDDFMVADFLVYFTMKARFFFSL